MFSQGRMLTALCNGDAAVGTHGDNGFSSYGGRYSFDGAKLECVVDMASDPKRVGLHQVREVVMLGEDELLLRPPPRLYGTKLEKRELVWKRVWHPDDE
jgi:hypothetical protein